APACAQASASSSTTPAGCQAFVTRSEAEERGDRAREEALARLAADAVELRLEELDRVAAALLVREVARVDEELLRDEVEGRARRAASRAPGGACTPRAGAAARSRRHPCRTVRRRARPSPSRSFRGSAAAS